MVMWSASFAPAAAGIGGVAGAGLGSEGLGAAARSSSALSEIAMVVGCMDSSEVLSSKSLETLPFVGVPSSAVARQPNHFQIPESPGQGAGDDPVAVGRRVTLEGQDVELLAVDLLLVDVHDDQIGLATVKLLLEFPVPGIAVFLQVNRIGQQEQH